MSRRIEDIELQDPNMGQQHATIAEIDRGMTLAGDERGVIRSGRLKGLTMWGAIVVLSWPVLLESFLNALVGLVDTMLAARISEAATSAIGIGSYFHWFVGLIAISLGVGATAMISRAMGKGREAVASAVVGQCVVLSLVLGTIAGALIAGAAPQIGILTGLDPDGQALDYAVDYLRIVALGVPGVTVLFVGIACCRGAGDSVKPLVVMAIVNVSNVLASFVLSGVDVTKAVRLDDGTLTTRTLLVNPSPLDMGVHGIAYGTLIAWWVGAVAMLVILARGTHGLRLKRKRLAPHWHTIRRLVRVGLPNFLETAGMWVGNFLTVLMVGWMGNELLHGAHIVAIRIEAFSFMPGFAMATAAATLTGQYLGAKRPDLARLAVFRCAAIAGGIMGLLGVAFVLIPKPITRVFSEQPLHLEQVPALLIACGLVQIPFALAIVFRGSLRGAGDTRAVMLLTWLSTWGIRLPLAWLCSGIEIPLPDGSTIPNPAPLQDRWDVAPLTGLWIGMCIELLLRGLLFIGRFLTGRWALVKV